MMTSGDVTKSHGKVLLKVVRWCLIEGGGHYWNSKKNWEILEDSLFLPMVPWKMCERWAVKLRLVWGYGTSSWEGKPTIPRSDHGPGGVQTPKNYGYFCEKIQTIAGNTTFLLLKYIYYTMNHGYDMKRSQTIYYICIWSPHCQGFFPSKICSRYIIFNIVTIAVMLILQAPSTPPPPRACPPAQQNPDRGKQITSWEVVIISLKPPATPT